MHRPLFLTLFLLLFTANAYAGLSYSSYDSRGSVVAAVEIEGKGIYNLVLSVQFLNEPYDKKPYTTDQYEELINRVSVEWRGVALKTILKNNKYKITDLPALELRVNKAIQELIKSSKSKYGIKNDAEVIFSTTSIYLVETDEN
ncbi:MAG: hypothetical protein AB2792_09520 [Candidatus Thiodiazotropha sp.]